MMLDSKEKKKFIRVYCFGVLMFAKNDTVFILVHIDSKAGISFLNDL